MVSAICDKIRSGSPEIVTITEHIEGHNGTTMEDNESIEDMSKKQVNEVHLCCNNLEQGSKTRIQQCPFVLATYINETITSIPET